MQSISYLPSTLCKDNFLSSSAQYADYEGVRLAESITPATTFNHVQVDQNTDNIQNTSLNDLNITKIASDAAVVDSDASLLEDLRVGSRVFRSESTETGFSLECPYQRTDDQVRTQYIDRLISLKVLKKDHTKPHQTVIAFDWDDTILPTTYLCYMGLDRITPDIEKKLALLDQSASKLLTKAARVGKVYIITNAQDTWVQTSSKTYLPLTSRIIEEGSVTVISARAEYEELYPGDPKKWKTETFLDVAESLNAQVPTNVLCFGDSEIEIEAAANMGKIFKQAIVKTVKLKACPKVEELIKQHNVILQKFDQIFTTLRNLTIKLEKKETL